MIIWLSVICAHICLVVEAYLLCSNANRSGHSRLFVVSRKYSIPRMIRLIVCGHSNLFVVGLWYSIPMMIGPIVCWHSNLTVKGLGYSNPMVDWSHSMLFMIICVLLWVWVFWKNPLSFQAYSFSLFCQVHQGIAARRMHDCTTPPYLFMFLGKLWCSIFWKKLCNDDWF